MTDQGRVYVAGHRGLAGSAVWRAYERRGGVDLIGRPSAELDLRDREPTFDLLTPSTPDTVVMAAAKVGGILGQLTRYPVDFLSDNLRIQTNVLDAAHAAASSGCCSSARPASTPSSRRSRSGVVAAHRPARTHQRRLRDRQDRRHPPRAGDARQYGHRWISAMPTNLYGPGDNYDPQSPTCSPR